MPILQAGDDPGVQQQNRHSLGVRAVSSDTVESRGEAEACRAAVDDARRRYKGTGTAVLVIRLPHDRRAGDRFVQAVGERVWI